MEGIEPSRVTTPVRRLIGTGRVALVTDAMAAAGMPDGRNERGGRDVTVARGGARLADGGAMAGGTATSARLFRRAVAELGLSPVEAARVTATTPAAVLGLAEVGALRAGSRADVVLLDAAYEVRGVLRAGEWVTAPSWCRVPNRTITHADGIGGLFGGSVPARRGRRSRREETGVPRPAGWPAGALPRSGGQATRRAPA